MFINVYYKMFIAIQKMLQKLSVSEKQIPGFRSIDEYKFYSLLVWGSHVNKIQSLVSAALLILLNWADLYQLKIKIKI